MGYKSAGGGLGFWCWAGLRVEGIRGLGLRGVGSRRPKLLDPKPLNQTLKPLNP